MKRKYIAPAAEVVSFQLEGQILSLSMKDEIGNGSQLSEDFEYSEESHWTDPSNWEK